MTGAATINGTDAFIISFSSSSSTDADSWGTSAEAFNIGEGTDIGEKKIALEVGFCGDIKCCYGASGSGCCSSYCNYAAIYTGFAAIRGAAIFSKTSCFCFFSNYMEALGCWGHLHIS